LGSFESIREFVGVIGSGNVSSLHWRRDHSSATFPPWSYSGASGNWWRHVSLNIVSSLLSSSTPSPWPWRSQQC